MTAPKEAALAIPRVYGVANGFENIDWKMSPADDKTAPTTNPSKTRGIR